MTSVSTSPRLGADTAEQIAREVFAITGTAIGLPSERDQNFRIETDGGPRYVLKIANAAESRDMLEAENAVMAHLAQTGLVPAVVRTRTGETLGRHGAHFVRVLSWIDGRALGETAQQGPALLEDFGRAMGSIDLALATMDHPALHRPFHWDLAGARAVVAEHLPRVPDPAMRGVIESIVRLHEATVVPRLPDLRRGVIHGDANDYNVLVDARAQRVTGLVDFGDMVVSHTVNDIAIAMAYAALGRADPIAAASAVLRGYHAVHPLTETEVAAVFGLMCMRLALSVCVASAQQAARPDNDYLGISQRAIEETLPRLVAVHPRLAHYLFRDACGLPPVPATPRVGEWLRAKADTFARVIGHDLRTARVLELDMSVGSPLVSSHPPENATAPFTHRVFEAMREAGVEIGVGGYNEARLIYAAEGFATGRLLDPRRTVHLGVDVTVEPGTPVHAPLDGIVHGFEDAGEFDYGPVIVLRHELLSERPLSFYTLYGHLTRESLHGLVVGKAVKAGERFAAVGAPPTNGNWWPHLHFQIVTDMLDVPCNFNGVALASQRATWLSLSPDPNLILGLPSRRPPVPSAADLLATRRARFGGNVRLSYGDRPLWAVRGSMQYLFDETGRRYIDAYNNVPHVGHAHPGVTRAVAAQLAVLNTNSRYLHATALEYAAALAERFPAPLEVCYFTTSGSEANELALRLARTYTGAKDLVVMDDAYHGHTTTLVDISPYKHAGPGGQGAPDWVHVSPVPDVYRGAYRADDAEAGPKYAREVGGVIDRIAARGRRLCGYIAETCPSVAGQIMLPKGFLSETYRLVRAAGGVTIADEVQTGFGRLGTSFWAFESHGVVPDIVVLGKPIANGYPLGAVITTRAIADRFDNGMEFFSTFGGSTAACAAGLATLRATIDEDLPARARAVGDHLLAGLRRLQARHDRIGDVRGSGLFIGVEIVHDRRTLAPATEDAGAIVLRMRELGVLTGTEGPHHNVIKIRGPMPLTAQDADLILEALDQALRD